MVAALFGLGLVAERFTVLPFLRAGSDVWVMSTLAVGLLLIDFAEIIWGRSPTPVPPFLGKDPIYFGAVTILPQQLLIIAAACITFVALDLFYRRTLLGKAFRAVAHSGEVSGLMGINTRRVQAVSYAAAAALAGFAGFLVVPLPRRAAARHGARASRPSPSRSSPGSPPRAGFSFAASPTAHSRH